MKELAEYNVEILAIYRAGKSVSEVADTLSVPEEHVRLIVKMVYGSVDETRKAAQTEVKKIEAESKKIETENKKTEAEVKKPIKSDEEKKKADAEKLAKLVAAKSKAKMATLVDKVKDDAQTFNNRDKAMMNLKLTFDSTYRAKYAEVKGLQGWISILEEMGHKDKESTKTEMQTIEKVERYFADVVKAEAEKRKRKVIAIYEREIQ